MKRVERVIRSDFAELEKSEQRALLEVGRSNLGVQIATAVLLGHNLWRGDVLAWKTRLFETPPPLWRFSDAPSAGWRVEPWLALSFEARLVRATAGALSDDTPLRVGQLRHDLSAAVYERGVHNLSPLRSAHDGQEYVRAIATASELAVDLALLQIYAHWFAALDNADRVECEPTALAYDVCGYREACPECRARWGARPREERWLPPFHPGCRCFAQPRYSRV